MKSEAQKRASQRWDAKHMGHISASMRADIAEAFRRKAYENGTTVNTLIREFAEKYIQEK